MKIKQIAAVILSIILVLSATACGTSTKSDKDMFISENKMLFTENATKALGVSGLSNIKNIQAFNAVTADLSLSKLKFMGEDLIPSPISLNANIVTGKTGLLGDLILKGNDKEINANVFYIDGIGGVKVDELGNKYFPLSDYSSTTIGTIGGADNPTGIETLPMSQVVQEALLSLSMNEEFINELIKIIDKTMEKMTLSVNEVADDKGEKVKEIKLSLTNEELKQYGKEIIEGVRSNNKIKNILYGIIESLNLEISKEEFEQSFNKVMDQAIEALNEFFEGTEENKNPVVEISKCFKGEYLSGIKMKILTGINIDMDITSSEDSISLNFSFSNGPSHKIDIKAEGKITENSVTFEASVSEGESKLFSFQASINAKKEGSASVLDINLVVMLYEDDVPMTISLPLTLKIHEISNKKIDVEIITEFNMLGLAEVSVSGRVTLEVSAKKVEKPSGVEFYTEEEIENMEIDLNDLIEQLIPQLA